MKTQHLQAIWKITEELRGAEQLEAALSSGLEIIADVISCEEGSLWLLNAEDSRLYAVVNIGKNDITGISIAKGQGIAGSVVDSGDSVIVEDCSKDERFSSSVDEETGFKTKSLICVPLKNSYETLGCIQLINKRDDSLFTRDELELCENFASLIAIAMEDRGVSLLPQKKKTPIITLRNVIKEYPSGDGKLRVLKGIDLDIYENEFLVVLGESGCGKSTMLNIIGGMDSLTEGTLTIDGKDFSHPTEHDLTEYRRNYIGFVFQSYNLMPNLTAKENIEFISEICQNPMSADEALAKVGLTQRAGNFPSQMSGGQQQRVSIARAIAKRPRVILADEPTAALDFQTGQEVLMLVEDIVKNQGTTVVMITHNVEIAKMANRVIKLKSGKVSSIRTNAHPMAAADISW
ncbi:MAG: ATP-binding cassette domain-containing protein [Clostridia bacterium]|nr:ATP-binding cassette domain-containing protein [Clostridia bacterium]